VPYIIYKRSKMNPVVVGVCNKSNVDNVLNKLNKDYVDRGDSPELTSLKTQQDAITDSIKQLNSSKFVFDKTLVPNHLIKQFTKMKEAANQEIGRQIMVKQKNLENVNLQIKKLKEVGGQMYYAVKVSLLKGE
jgi:hypothetical protein